jgi:OOP family OmpA-OmpF porin
MKTTTWTALSLAAGMLVSAAALAADAEAPKVKIESGQTVLPGPVEFETGSATITEASKPVLDVLRDFLNGHKDLTKVRIEGHTDNAGVAKDNLELTKKRALAVAKYLVAGGVDAKRLLPVGFGDTKPVESNDSPESRAKNRRITIVPAEMRGRLIGGMPADGGGVVAGDPGE